MTTDAERDATIAELQAQIALRNETIRDLLLDGEANNSFMSALRKRVKECDQIVAAGEAERKALAAQVAELSVTVEQLQAQVAELQEWRDEAVSVAHARWLPPTDARSPIEIAPSVKVELHDYLMAQAPSGEGYSEFIKRALNLRRMLD